jgi:hypothetical protein
MNRQKMRETYIVIVVQGKQAQEHEEQQERQE